MHRRVASSLGVVLGRREYGQLHRLRDLHHEGDALDEARALGERQLVEEVLLRVDDDQRRAVRVEELPAGGGPARVGRADGAEGQRRDEASDSHISRGV